MSIVLTIIAFIVIFSVLILVHELGHFVMAKRSGIKVLEFGFGLPPRIWGKKKGETIYSINWIPFGGFVKMMGEDSFDPKMIKEKRSFAAQPMRKRVKVIVAGVLMNFILAWLLLSVGFTFGMQPLLVPGDVLGAVSDGGIVLAEGVKVKDVAEGGIGEKMGLKADDVIFSVNGQVLDALSIEKFINNPVGVYQIERKGNVFNYEVKEEEMEWKTEFFDFVVFPRVRIFGLNEMSKAYKAGLREGDIIVSVNENQVFSVEEFERFVRGERELEYEVFRSGLRENIIVELSETRNVIVSSVIPDSPAYEAGLKNRDIIISVNGNYVDDSLELIEFVEGHSDENLAFLVDREGERIFYEVKPEEGKIGVLLSELMAYGSDSEMSVYNVDVISSVLKIEDVKYPFYEAPFKAFGEGIRLSKITGEMFIGFVGGFIRGRGVPGSVAGPVGIAQLTHTFVQEGFIPLLRFVAILSLSLAVINILPIPALDGGRLLFVLIEFIAGRKVNQKWESYLHGLGYVLILLLILAVTYSDIVKLVKAG
ncbi:MAG: RIP metalloprotease RseP [Candidatus Peregrinibacteria bacterium]